MSDLIHEFIAQSAQDSPDAPALLFKNETRTYAELHAEIRRVANSLLNLGIAPGERVAVYLPKQFETVFALFGAAAAGACFVPVNPLLKPRQLAHILPHCNVRVLVTSAQRIDALRDVLADCTDLHTVILVDGAEQEIAALPGQQCIDYTQWRDVAGQGDGHRRIDSDMAAILYTSGSTGNPKGVVLSHRNLVAGANSVAQYLQNNPTDRLLGVLPLSFDAGLSQLTTAFSVGASVVLMDYLLPRDVIRAVARHTVTGLAAVPPLWNQLRDLAWPEEAVQSLRYITNTGGGHACGHYPRPAGGAAGYPDLSHVRSHRSVSIYLPATRAGRQPPGVNRPRDPERGNPGGRCERRGVRAERARRACPPRRTGQHGLLERS